MKRFVSVLIFGSLAMSSFAGPLARPVAPAVSPLQASAADAVFEAAAPLETTTLSPMVEITKKCPQLRYLGREATFEITVTNKGNAAAQSVTVTDTIAGGVEIVSIENNGTRDGSNIVWRLGKLDAGQSQTLKVNVRCNQIGTVKNTATVSYCAEAAASCEFPVRGIPAILLECTDDPDPIEVGGQLTYTIIVTNQGSETGTNITVNCTLPAEQEFVKAGGATNATSEGKAVKFEPLATLAPKARATFTVTVKGVKAADSRFKVSMKSDQIESPVEETESTHIYE